MPQSGGLLGPPRHAARLPRPWGLEGEEGRGRLLPLPTFRSPCLGCSGKPGWGEVWCVGRGENPAGMSTNHSGDKPPAQSWAPPPNRGTPLSEASSNPCMAVTERLPQRDHSVDPRGKPPCPAQVLWGLARLSSGPALPAVHPGELLPYARSSRRRGSGRQGE